ncbi:MAG: hypothetical protein ACRET6_12650 [Burkholderiales bacterium]
MSKVKQTNIGSGIYRRIQEVQMSEIERHTALRAMRHAEAMVDLLFWVKEKAITVGAYFLKPSLKH